MGIHNFKFLLALAIFIHFFEIDILSLEFIPEANKKISLKTKTFLTIW
jgi:hypothetical protein